LTPVPPPARSPVVFLDRDGTIIEDTGYVREPARVTLIAGAAEAIGRLNAAGIPVVVVTNQSGLARGILTESEYTEVARRLDALLAAAGAHLDATRWCPHAPEVSGPCACRKPGTLLHHQGADALGYTAEGGWCVGDRLTDLLPARALHGQGLLVQTGEGRAHESAAMAAGFSVVADLDAAVSWILSGPGQG